MYFMIIFFILYCCSLLLKIVDAAENRRKVGVE